MHGKAPLVSIRKEKREINLEPVLVLHHRETIEDDTIVPIVSSARLETVQTLENTKNNRSPT
jgi:hypothetical protein